ncbi:MAG TPA: hypothetical protein VGI82_10120, partial [Chitinophagaceae bacterium]
RPDKKNYEPRDNVEINLVVSKGEDHPQLSLMNVSVTDDNAVKYFYDDDIANVMKKPFSAADNDLVMLAQKSIYRKWNLSDRTSSVSDHRADDNFFNEHGRVVNKKGGPLSNIVVTLFSTQGRAIFKSDTTDNDGHFNFNLPGDVDSIQFMLQATDLKGRPVEAKIALDSILAPRFTTPAYLKKPLPAAAYTEIAQKKSEPQDFLLSGQGKELSEVIVNAKVRKPAKFDEKKRMSLFSRIITTDMVTEGGTNNISSSVLMMPGAHLRNGKLIIDPGGNAEPLVIMDGVQVQLDDNMIHIVSPNSGRDTVIEEVSMQGPSPLVNFLNSLSPAYIDFIEVLYGSDAAIYGVRAANGVIIINSRTSPRNTDETKSILKKFYPPGYTLPSFFSQPDYTRKEIKKNNSSDRRSTVYWSGPLITDENGKAMINFFTADPNTTYTVTIEGITTTGDIILKRFPINRK